MFLIEIYETATTDLQESYDWYEDQSASLGDKFVKEVDECLELIGENPFQFAVQFSGKYRFALLKHFPFRIVYRIDESKNCVYVSSIFHTSRNPKKF